MIHHGGELSFLRQRYPDAPEPLVDLSTGINPFPYPVPPIPETAYTRLPEAVHIRTLKKAAAAAYGARDADLVAVAPGTQILISSLPRLFPARRVAIRSPTYGEFAPVWDAAGANVVEGAGTEVLEEGDVAILCNPNNPDGRGLDPERVLELQARRARAGGCLIVDEAFAEFSEANRSVVPALPRQGLIVLRSFGKAYGLAGLRLGFLIAEPEIARRSKRRWGRGRFPELRSMPPSRRSGTRPGGRRRRTGWRGRANGSIRSFPRTGSRRSAEPRCFAWSGTITHRPSPRRWAAPVFWYAIFPNGPIG